MPQTELMQPLLGREPICLYSRNLADRTRSASLHLNDVICAASAPETTLGLQVCFSGVLYNLDHLRVLYDLDSATPEQAIAALYRRLGTRITTVLDGAYAIVILDNNRVTLFRDREGLESLYTYRRGDNFIIANSIGQIRQLVRLEVNHAALPRYFVLDQLNDEQTFFKDVYQVSVLKFMTVDLRSNTWSAADYDDLPYSPIAIQKLDDAEIIEGLETRLSDRIKSLTRAFPGCQVLNTQSGGTDSALTQCLLRQTGHNRSICANFSDFGMDARYSQDVARHLDSDHRIVDIDVGCFFENIKAAIKIFEMPLIFEGESMFNHLYGKLGNGSSRGGPPVICFDSNGADAILGHGRLLMALSQFQEAPGLADFVTGLASQFSRKGLAAMMHDIARGARSGEMTPEFYFAVFNLKKRVSLVQQAFGLDDVASIVEFELAEQAKYPVDLLERVYRLQVFQYEVKRINNITYNLAKRHNVVTLHPFRDRALTEFFLNIQTRRKIKRGVQKYYGKKLLEKYLPRDMIYRKKINKGIPYIRLFREDKQFSELIEELKASPPSYFEFDLEQIFGRAELAPFAMKLINLHLWHDLFLR